MKRSQVPFHFSLSSHYLKDQVRNFIKLPACQFLLLGVDSIEAYYDSLKYTTSHDTTKPKICILRLPASENQDDNRGLAPGSAFSEYLIKGLFVPKDRTDQHRLSYVDIVQRQAKATSHEANSVALVPFGTRKISNASTVSTQAEDEWLTRTKGSERKVSCNPPKTSNQDDFMSINSDFSELACTTKQRKIRMDNRKKEVQAVKHDNGLLAQIPCPTEEPDRSGSRF